MLKIKIPSHLLDKTPKEFLISEDESYVLNVGICLALESEMFIRAFAEQGYLRTQSKVIVNNYLNASKKLNDFFIAMFRESGKEVYEAHFEYSSLFSSLLGKIVESDEEKRVMVLEAVNAIINDKIKFE